MGEHNSLYYAAGQADASIDALRIGSCPPFPARGPDPEKDWSWMYRRGYESVVQVPHICDKSCRQGAA